MKVRVDNGKYTFEKVFKTGVIRILRHGEPWHEQSDAGNALASVMAELDAARVVLDAARALGEAAPIKIQRALKQHRALVDDREPPSEWSHLVLDCEPSSERSHLPTRMITLTQDTRFSAEIVGDVVYVDPNGFILHVDGDVAVSIVGDQRMLKLTVPRGPR